MAEENFKERLYDLTTCDALVIGAGYYGCRIALRLRELGLDRVLIVDREIGIMTRASFGNQARIHNGYHYPRAPLTASSSRRNFARFVEEHSYAVDFGLTKLYGIAHGSRVNPNQFERFCGDVGASFKPLAPHALRLFDPDMVEAAYEVEELVFDAKLIAQRMEHKLAQANIDLRLSTIARIAGKARPLARVEVNGQGVDAALVFNCTYAGLDTVAHAAVRVADPDRSGVVSQGDEIACWSHRKSPDRPGSDRGAALQRRRPRVVAAQAARRAAGEQTPAAGVERGAQQHVPERGCCSARPRRSHAPDP